jgi:hypothetical protein
VIHQPLADALEMPSDRDPEIAQMSGGSDTGAQKMGRRMDRAAGENDLARVEVPPAGGR